jgi:hypothetical protein
MGTYRAYLGRLELHGTILIPSIGLSLVDSRGSTATTSSNQRREVTYSRTGLGGGTRRRMSSAAEKKMQMQIWKSQEHTGHGMGGQSIAKTDAPWPPLPPHELDGRSPSIHSCLSLHILWTTAAFLGQPSSRADMSSWRWGMGRGVPTDRTKVTFVATFAPAEPGARRCHDCRGHLR